MAGELRVIATAGHVDHGKSSLIVRLTGIDPDRFAEEKRRGLTIDLGYAWTRLGSGREVGFVDVPGHERFVRNMLAGVGPVRLVLFVVAADEGWKPQSEEHLQILDVLGVAGGVVALTKRDLVDDETLAIATDEVTERVEGTALEGAPIVAVSSVTGEGLEPLRSALDEMLTDAPAPEDGRARLHVDRVFTIKGAGTVATGTLAGGCVAVGDEIELYPTGRRARIRSLQTHKKAEERACHVARVAANLAGADRDDLVRGDVLGVPGAWRPTNEFEAELRTVRQLADPIGVRGAFQLHAGAGEAEARLRFLGGGKLEPGGSAMVRIRTSRPLVLDVLDRFVLRDAGRGRTVGGGIVLDVAPPRRGGRDRVAALATRAAAPRAELPSLLAAERGAVRASLVEPLVGAPAPADLLAGEWCISPALVSSLAEVVSSHLEGAHAAEPLAEGAPADGVRRAVAAALRAVRAPTEVSLADAVIGRLAAEGRLVRSGGSIRLPTHHVRLDERSEELERLVAAVSGPAEATPPTIAELVATGYARDVIEAAARSGVVVKIAPELVVSPGLVARAEETIAGGAGVSVSALRQALGTTRKYAVPLVEWLDRQGRTRRDGDLRFPAT